MIFWARLKNIIKLWLRRTLVRFVLYSTIFAPAVCRFTFAVSPYYNE